MDPKTFINEFVEYYKDEILSKKNTVYSFNILSEQCGHIVENSHTNILMKLLQYRNKYGYEFLKTFCEKMGIEINLPNEEIKFRTEYSIKKDNVEDDGRMDGLIYKKGQFAIVIENKINHASPMQRQLKRYIEHIIRSPEIFDIAENDIVEKCKVIYLSLDGDYIDSPDKESIDYLQDLGIIDTILKDEDGLQLTGPSYFPINYKDDILPWLTDDIMPMIMHKEKGLSTGVSQYIYYLRGLFENNLLSDDLYTLCKQKCIEMLKSNGIDVDNRQKFDKDVKPLHKLYLECKMIKKKGISDNEEFIVVRDARQILYNIIDEIKDNYMKDFIDLTKQYFESHKLYSRCRINYHFSYYYILIRNSEWPKNVYFAWYPMGRKLLTTDKKQTYTLTFHYDDKEDDKWTNVKKSLIEVGFEDNGKSLELKCQSDIPIMKMNKDETNKFLCNSYSVITTKIIEQINLALQENE